MLELDSIAIVFDFAGTLTEKDLERKATVLCCQRYEISPEMISKMVSGRGTASEVGQSVIDGCFEIFRQAVETARISPEAIRAVDRATEKLGSQDFYISTNARSSWVKKSLMNNRMDYFRSVFGRDEGSKEDHFRKILIMGEGRYKTVIVFGDNLHDFPQNVGNGIKVIRVAVNVPLKERDKFDQAKLDVLFYGPLTVDVMAEALMEAENKIL